jgi:hypothetical protein
VAQAESSGEHRDVRVNVADAPPGILGDRPPIALGQGFLARFQRARDHLRNGDRRHHSPDATAVDRLDESAK